MKQLKENKQYTPDDQSAKARNLFVTTQDEQTYEKSVYMSSVSDREVDSVSLSLSEHVWFESRNRAIKQVTSLIPLSTTNTTNVLKMICTPSDATISN